MLGVQPAEGHRGEVQSREGKRVMKNLKGSLMLAVLVSLGLLASQATSAEQVRLKKKQLGDTEPVHAYGDIYLAGQPSPEELPLLEAAGIKTIISLRHKKELPWDEAATVKQNGMDFVHVPFAGAQQLKPEVFDKVLKVLRDKKRGPTVLHCGAANRVGAIWYAYRVLDGNLSPDEAMKEAQTVGLRTPAYLEKAQEYVKAVQQAEEAAENRPSSPPN